MYFLARKSFSPAPGKVVVVRESPLEVGRPSHYHDKASREEMAEILLCAAAIFQSEAARLVNFLALPPDVGIHEELLRRLSTTKLITMQ